MTRILHFVLLISKQKGEFMDFLCFKCYILVTYISKVLQFKNSFEKKILYRKGLFYLIKSFPKFPFSFFVRNNHSSNLFETHLK